MIRVPSDSSSASRPLIVALTGWPSVMVMVTALLIPAAIPLPVTVNLYVPSTSALSVGFPLTVTVFLIFREPLLRVFVIVKPDVLSSAVLVA